MGITLLFTVFAVLLLLGVPVAYALAAAALATLWYLDLPTLVLVQQKTIPVWDCGDGGDDYSIEVRRGFTTEAGFREVTGGITSSGDGLYVASYTALTMAAQFDDETLPSKHEADAHVTLEPGPYRLRIVQRFDPTQIGKREGPDFIVELEQGECEPLSAVAWLQTSPA